MHVVPSRFVCFGQQSDILLEGGDQFLFRDSADGTELCIHCHVHQVVDGREDAQLRELRDARDKAEPDFSLHSFQWLEEFLHHLAHIFQTFILMQHVEQWCIIFVDDDCHLPVL